MPIPTLRQGEFLIAPIQVDPTDEDVLLLATQLLERGGLRGVSAVIIDVSALDVIDSFMARSLRNITQALRLRGCETAVVGIQPQVAVTMVRLGLALPGIVTTLDLESGFEALHRRLRSRVE